MPAKLPDEVLLRVRLAKPLGPQALRDALEHGKLTGDVTEMVVMMGDRSVAFCNRRCRYARKGKHVVEYLAHIILSVLNLRECRVKGCMPCKGRTRPTLSWGG